MCIERYFLMYFSITALFHALPFFIVISSLFTLSQLSFLFCSLGSLFFVISIMTNLQRMIMLPLFLSIQDLLHCLDVQASYQAIFLLLNILLHQ